MDTQTLTGIDMMYISKGAQSCQNSRRQKGNMKQLHTEDSQILGATGNKCSSRSGTARRVRDEIAMQVEGKQERSKENNMSCSLTM
jgi:hypothetical protein